ncbi:MAG TPA: fumarylacetoacetate hydrolase family protein [Candidatus Limnocylindrales bacterium]|nr:fumarylacetoacetate hydrolase family protein [Candidatus Limnocylindrales bacterium]
MDPIQVHLAAQMLWNAWQEGLKIENLPEACRPRTLEEGYAIQTALVTCSGRPVLGWKIAATSQAGQAHIGVDRPLAGRLLAGKISTSPATWPLGTNRMRVAELEFAFRLARDFPPRGRDYTVEEIMSGVASLHPAIEIPDSRFKDFDRVGAPQLIADNACACFFVLGNETTADWRSTELSTHPVSLILNSLHTDQGSGANVLGDPRIALTWLANELITRGEELKAGQIVTTGTCLRPVRIKPGDRVVGDFGLFGTVEVVFTD